MPLPSGLKFEVEFVAGVWTDVTADVDHNAGYTIHVGRTAPREQVQASSATVSLINPTGKYTPGLQVLTDGTAAPHYPNVTVRKRLRISNSSGTRFVGFIKSWLPQTNGFPGSARCQVTATDWLTPLSGIVLQWLPLEEFSSQSASLGDAQSALYLFNDTPPDTGPMELTQSAGTATPTRLDLIPVQGVLTSLERPVPVSDGLTGVGTSGATVDGVTVSIQGTFPFTPSAFAFSFWLIVPVLPVGSPLLGDAAQNFGIANASQNGLVIFTIGYPTTPAGSCSVNLGAFAGTPYVALSTAIASTVANDGGSHHYTVTGVTTAGTEVLSLYIDGVLKGTTSFAASGLGTALLTSIAGLIQGTAAGLTPNMGPMSFHTGGAYTSALAVGLNNAGRGFLNDTSDARITRFLDYAGVSTADRNLDAGGVTLASQPVNGQDVLSLCQAVTDSEGGGAAFYVLGGIVRFVGRRFRKPTAPALTVDVMRDADRENFQPGLDDQALANSSTASRSSESGVRATQTWVDAPSVALNGVASSDVTTYTRSNNDALNLAQFIVADGRTSGLRFPQITVDLLTAEHNLYAAVQATEIGDRIRATSIPAGAASATQTDVLAEGWTETGNISRNTIAFDTSPADNPPRGVWDDTVYGRWQAAPDCALNAAITSTATTVVIKSPTAPTFTTTSARYPMNVQVGAEIITLNSAPGGATSPQTFAGVTRGVNGTTAAAQAINSRVQLWPASTWTL